MADDVPLLRVVQGDPTAEETAAVVLALLALRARSAAAAPEPAGRDTAAWLRLERSVAFQPGHSWQRDARMTVPA